MSALVRCSLAAFCLFHLVLPTAQAEASSAQEATLLNAPDSKHRLKLNAELGFLGVPAHSIQFSKDGSPIDYVAQGGQDVLFTFARASADLSVGRHTFILLFQPLELKGREQLREDVVIDEQLFPTGTVVDFRYSFPFYRFSYLNDLLPTSPDELAIGLSLQLRNATIDFSSVDGTLFRANRNVGPVPILKVRARKELTGGYFVGAEADGFYAPIKYLNGGDADVVGSILDASVRGGVKLRPGVEAFVNVRYVGGGAEGTNPNGDLPGDGFTSNWLHLVAVSLGLSAF